MDRGLSKLEVAVTSICILATSVTAGSIFCFPIFGPSLTRDLGLSLTQTNTIWSGAVLGEYISAAFWGSLADRFGPNLLCVSAAVLFGSGYLLMSHADSTAIKMLESGQDLGILQSWHSPSGFVAMSAYFVLVGAGVAASYFSAVIASTRLFPSTPGLAISIPLTLFSLSSLFLSWIGTQFFVDPETGELNTPSFLTFLGVLLFCVNMTSALAMRIGEKPQDPTTIQESESSNLRTDLESTPPSNSTEETPLLNNPTNPSKSIFPGAPLTSSLASLLKAPSFLALALLLFVAVGGAEMVMSSVGAMTVSLLGSLGGKDQVDTFAKEVLRRGILISLGGTEIHSHSSDIDPGPKLGGEALRIRSAQVSLLALANTLARLSAGLASDLLSPNPLKKSLGQESNTASRNQTLGDQIKELFTKGKVPQSWSLSRMSLILFAMAVLLFAFVFSAFGLDSTDQLPMVSILTGVGYGLIFALIPSIMATAYGLAQFGRNWGIASYSCAAGSLSFSLLYATISDYVASKHPISKAEQDGEESGSSGICYGNECFKASFVVATLGLLIAFLPIFQLWRKWRWFL